MVVGLRKRIAAIVICVFAVALFVYHYSLLAKIETQKPAPTPTATVTLSPNPTSAPANESTDEPKVKVSFIDWDPHNSSYPTQIVILYPHNETYTAGWWPQLQVGVSSDYWLINGVFYTADWLDGYHPIWFYNLGAYRTALYATVSLEGIPDGTHTIVVHANLHDGSHMQTSVAFTVNSTVKP